MTNNNPKMTLEQARILLKDWDIRPYSAYMESKILNKGDVDWADVDAVIEELLAAKELQVRQEYEVYEKLLNDRENTLKLIPECPAHGFCLPFKEDWIKGHLREDKLKDSVTGIPVTPETPNSPEIPDNSKANDSGKPKSSECEDLDPEISKLVDKHFWELTEPQPERAEEWEERFKSFEVRSAFAGDQPIALRDLLNNQDLNWLLGKIKTLL